MAVWVKETPFGDGLVIETRVPVADGQEKFTISRDEIEKLLIMAGFEQE